MNFSARHTSSSAPIGRPLPQTARNDLQTENELLKKYIQDMENESPKETMIIRKSSEDNVDKTTDMEMAVQIAVLKTQLDFITKLVYFILIVVFTAVVAGLIRVSKDAHSPIPVLSAS